MGWRYMSMIGILFLMMGLFKTISGNAFGLLYVALGIIMLAFAYLRMNR